MIEHGQIGWRPCPPPTLDPPSGRFTSERASIEELLDDYRTPPHDCVNGLTEDEAQMRLVPSKTTLLGLLKRVAFVARVWFDQAVTGRSSGDRHRERT